MLNPLLLPILEEQTPVTSGGFDSVIAALLNTPQGFVTVTLGVAAAILAKSGFFRSLLLQIADEHPSNIVAMQETSVNSNASVGKALELALMVTQAREEALKVITGLELQIDNLTKQLEHERKVNKKLADRVVELENKVNELMKNRPDLAN